MGTRTEKFLSTAAVAKAAGVGREKLRFYEQKGLINPVARTAAGYRQFSRDAVDTIAFIKQTQRAGFSLKEILQLFRLRSARADTCGAIAPMLGEKLKQLDIDLATLHSQRDALAELANTCGLQDAKRGCGFVGSGPGCC